MIYKHGSYEHDVHVLEVSHQPEWADGVLLRTTSRILIEGKVEGANQTELTDAIEELEEAYLETPVTTSGLYQTGGSVESAHVLDLTGANTENGIVAVVRWVDGGAEYVYKRSFVIELTCIFLGDAASAVEYQNRIVRIGDGGPIHRVFPTFDGLVMQQIMPNSPFFAVESGSKSSRLGVVSIPAATLDTDFLKHDQSQTESGVGQSSDGITTHFASWTYYYEADVAI